MRSKNICLIAFISIVAVITDGCYKFSNPFRFPGDRGEIYETWETSNNNFKIRITAYHEVGIYLPGAFFVCESAPVDSNEWREFKFYRADDAIPILRERFRFVNDQTAYYYTADDFLVTVDSGKNWLVWQPILPQSNGERVLWAITEAYVEVNGIGRAKLWNYDKHIKDVVTLEVHTEDYGQNWSVIRNTTNQFNR